MKNYNNFCKGYKCPEFIEWHFHGKVLKSCRKIGESENISVYPDDCNFITEIKKINLSL